MKLCVFQGTFNPIHKAHLQMAEYVLKHYGFDKIIFIPAYKPPHKDYNPQMSIHRLNMVKLATAYNPNFLVSDIEYQREGKSYSYITAQKLYKMYDVEGKIKFIIGTDAFEKIETWYESDKFKKLVDFIVFTRENNLQKTKYEELKKKGYNFEFTQMDYLEISSTELREKIKNNQFIDNLITTEVKGYIEKNGLYKD